MPEAGAWTIKLAPGKLELVYKEKMKISILTKGEDKRKSTAIKINLN